MLKTGKEFWKERHKKIVNNPNKYHKFLYKETAFLLCAVLFAIVFNVAAISAKTKKPFADSGEILAELTFTSSISKSKEQTNKELIEAVQTRGTEFILSEEDEISLRNAGASELLIKAIFENVSAEIKKKFKENLYSIYIENTEGDFLKIAKKKVKAAREFLRLFGDSKEDKVLVDYFNENLPIIEAAIATREKKEKESAKEKEENYNSRNLDTKFDKKPLKLKEIIEKLNKTSGAEDEQKLIKEICERGADFALNSESEKSLREAGASDLIIRIIKDLSPEIQNDKERLYGLYVANYDKTIDKRKIALNAGKKYLEKYENNECKSSEVLLIDYFKENLPILEKTIKEAEDRDSDPKPDYHPRPKRDQYVKKFNNAVLKNDWDEVFKNGALILDEKPEFLDLALILAAIGYEQAVEQKQKSKYDEKAIYYAELAVKLIEKGETSENYGASFGKTPDKFYQYKTKDFPNGKENALGWMNYIVGYIKYYQQNKRDEAIPYFNKAAQYKSEVRNFPELNRAIGDQ